MKAIKVVGCILAVLQFVLSVLLVYLLYTTKLIPFKWMVVGAVVILLLPIIIVLMMKGKKSSYVGIILSIIMSGILCYGVFLVNSTNRTLDTVTDNKVEVEQVNVYVRKEDSADSINMAVDAGYKFGIIKNSDSENVTTVINQINDDFGTEIKVVEYDSVYDLAVAFELDNIQSFIINSGMLAVLESSDNYENYSESLKVIMEKEIETQIEEVVEEKPEFDKNRFCMYISGIDTYGSVNQKSRSDVNIIAVVNTQTRTMLLVSTPRDYYVEMPCIGNQKDKLTHAGVFGIDASMETLERLYNVDLNYYLRMNFSGFEEIVDELGGIDVYSEVGFTAITDDEFQQGYNHLDGKHALTFARERMAFMSGDRQRGNNQMAVIKAIVEKVESSDMLKNYSSVMDSLAGTFQTDMSKDEVGDIVQQMLEDMKSWNIYSFSVSGSDGEDVCSSMGAVGYVMYPYESDVEFGKQLIQKVLGDGTISQEEINEYMNQ